MLKPSCLFHKSTVSFKRSAPLIPGHVLLHKRNVTLRICEHLQYLLEISIHFLE